MTLNQSLIFFFNLIFLSTFIHPADESSFVSFEGNGIIRHEINDHRRVDGYEYNVHLQVSNRGWEILCRFDESSDAKTTDRKDTPVRQHKQSIKYRAFYISSYDAVTLLAVPNPSYNKKKESVALIEKSREILNLDNIHKYILDNIRTAHKYDQYAILYSSRNMTLPKECGFIVDQLTICFNMVKKHLQSEEPDLFPQLRDKLAVPGINENSFDSLGISLGGVKGEVYRFYNLENRHGYLFSAGKKFEEDTIFEVGLLAPKPLIEWMVIHDAAGNIPHPNDPAKPSLYSTYKGTYSFELKQTLYNSDRIINALRNSTKNTHYKGLITIRHQDGQIELTEQTSIDTNSILSSINNEVTF